MIEIVDGEIMFKSTKNKDTASNALQTLTSLFPINKILQNSNEVRGFECLT